MPMEVGALKNYTKTVLQQQANASFLLFEFNFVGIKKSQSIIFLISLNKKLITFSLSLSCSCLPILLWLKKTLQSIHLSWLRLFFFLLLFCLLLHNSNLQHWDEEDNFGSSAFDKNLMSNTKCFSVSNKRYRKIVTILNIKLAISIYLNYKIIPKVQLNVIISILR